MTRIAAGLEKSGLAERVSDAEDARRVTIAATAKGRQLLLAAQRRRVESLAPFNLLMNYWWESGASATRAEAALIHTLLAMENLRSEQKAAWKAVFDHLAFRADDEPVAHIPPEVRGWLGALTPDLRDQMRNFIRRSLLE